MFKRKLVSARTIESAGGLDGCDYVYTMQISPREVFSRIVVFSRQGKRFVVRNSEPEPGAFSANMGAFEELLDSLVLAQ